MLPSDVLRRRHAEIMAVIARYPAANPRVFGSVARGEDDEASDLDILVDDAGPLSLLHLVRMERELGDLLAIKVGVHTLHEFGAEARTLVLKDARQL